MPVYHLPAKPAVAVALAAGLPVASRLIEVATSAGYVIGEGSVQVYADGRVTIDADRDPTADWLAWDPTIPTAEEQSKAQLHEAIRDARAGLQEIETVASGGANLTQAQIKTGFVRLADTLDTLIGVLVQRGVLD